MNVLNAAASLIVVLEVFFQGVHDHRIWKYPLNEVSCTEIAFKFLHNPSCCVLLYLLNHRLEKLLLVVVNFLEFLQTFNSQYFLFLVTYKGMPQLLWIFVDIFCEEKHDGEPDIIRGYFDISMLVVSVEEGLEKPIVESWLGWGMATLSVVDDFPSLVLHKPASPPKILHVISTLMVVVCWDVVLLVVEVLQVDNSERLVLHI